MMMIIIIIIIIVELGTNARQYYNARYDGECFHLASHTTTKFKSPAPVTWSYFSTRKWLARTGLFGNVRRLDFCISRKPPHRIFTHNFDVHVEKPVWALAVKDDGYSFLKTGAINTEDQKRKGRQRTFSNLSRIYIYIYFCTA